MQELIVGAADVGVRLDVFVAKNYPQFARSALEVLFKNDLVKVNGQIGKPGNKLHKGDKVSVSETILFRKPEAVNFPVIHEDEHVVVMNKPEGVLTHSKGNINHEGTVATFLKPKITDERLNGNRAGIVHRLDRATSGVIIGVKNTEALTQLQKQFAQRKTKKNYYAIVAGWPDPMEALIDAPIARNPKRPQTFMVAGGGKSAQTEYKTIEQFQKKGNKYSLLELKPLTGRTHQLRVHLAKISHPIVGDPVYGKAGSTVYLHAESLEVTLPGGARKIFTAPLPKKFEKFMTDE
jgi:23S rRNA pseudouridine1911/1915/1917 synthase